jgi:hypothetical protein
MPSRDEKRVNAASWIAAAMAVRFASKVFDDVPTSEACNSAHDLLVEALPGFGWLGSWV